MIGLAWRKSSKSNPNGACLEARRNQLGYVTIRHSRAPRGPMIAFSPAEWRAFTEGVRAGEFDLPDEVSGDV